MNIGSHHVHGHSGSDVKPRKSKWMSSLNDIRKPSIPFPSHERKDRKKDGLLGLIILRVLGIFLIISISGVIAYFGYSIYLGIDLDGAPKQYLQHKRYEEVFEGSKERGLRMLELGVYGGAQLELEKALQVNPYDLEANMGMCIILTNYCYGRNIRCEEAGSYTLFTATIEGADIEELTRLYGLIKLYLVMPSSLVD